jgi:hypothetical protein
MSPSMAHILSFCGWVRRGPSILATDPFGASRMT